MLKKYLTAFKLSFVESHTYRAHMLVWVLNGFLWVGVMPFVWLTIYGTRDTLAGFEKTALVTYFFLVPLMEIITASWVYESMQYAIKEGRLVNFILKPINYLVYMFFQGRGWQTTQIIMTFIIVAIISIPLRNYIDIPYPTMQTFWLIPVLIVSILVSYLCAVVIGLVSFFTTSGGWMKHFWWMFTMIAAGYLVPIQFYPEWLQHALSLTPFPLFLQTPIFILLGRISSEQIIHDLFVGAAWILALLPLIVLMWKKGTKRFDSLGV